MLHKTGTSLQEQDIIGYKHGCAIWIRTQEAMCASKQKLKAN